MNLKYPLKLPLKLPLTLPLFLRNWNAAMLASQINFEAKKRWDPVNLDILEFDISSSCGQGPFEWRARARRWLGYGDYESVTLRSQRGFATAEGVLGALSEVAANIVVVYPDIDLVLYTSVSFAPGLVLKRFDASSMAWEPLTDRNLECASCDERLTLEPHSWYRSSRPLCQQCGKMMREVDNPKA